MRYHLLHTSLDSIWYTARKKIRSLFTIQFVFNDNYTVINFKFGGIFSDFFLVHNYDRHCDRI